CESVPNSRLEIAARAPIEPPIWECQRMLTIIDQNDLLTALYDGPFDQPLWSTFLERLRARLNATYAGIVFRPPDRPEGSRIIELSAGERPSPEFSARYRERLYKADPFPTLPMRD